MHSSGWEGGLLQIIRGGNTGVGLPVGGGGRGYPSNRRHGNPGVWAPRGWGGVADPMRRTAEEYRGVGYKW